MKYFCYNYCQNKEKTLLERLNIIIKLWMGQAGSKNRMRVPINYFVTSILIIFIMYMFTFITTFLVCILSKGNKFKNDRYIAMAYIIDRIQKSLYFCGCFNIKSWIILVLQIFLWVSTSGGSWHYNMVVLY